MTELTRTEPVLAPSPPLRRRSPRRLLATAAAVVALAAAVPVVLTVVGGSVDPGGVAFAIERPGPDTVRVQVVDSEVSAKAMTRQLRDAGVNATVSTMPASPQLVGTWVAEGFSADVPGAVRDAVIAQTAGYSATLELPTQFPGRIELTVGRAPRNGEQIMVGGRRNALAPGAALYCLRLVGATPARAAALLAAAGYTPHWADGNTDALKALSTPVDAWRVAEAFVVDDALPRDVQVVLTAPTSPRFEIQAWKGFAPSLRAAGRRDYAGCS